MQKSTERGLRETVSGHSDVDMLLKQPDLSKGLCCFPLAERALFTRERNDGLYRVITYLCAKILDELMLAAVASGIFGAIVFFPVKLKGSFALFWLVYFLTLSNGIGEFLVGLPFI